MDVRQTEVAALEAVGEAFVVDAEEVQDGGLEVVDVDGMIDGVEAEVVGSAESEAGLDSAASYPDGEGIWMMIAAPAGSVVDVALNERRATEFAAPDDERVIQHAAHFQVLNKRGARLIGVFALRVEFGRQAVVLVPAGVHALDEADSAFGKATGHQAVVSERAGFLNLWAVHVEDMLWFVGEVCEFRHRRLHLVGHFVLSHPSLNFRISRLLKLQLIQRRQVIQEGSTQFSRHAVRIIQIQYWIAAASETGSLESRWQETGTPVEVVEDLTARCAFADRGHHNKPGQFL